MVWFGVVWCGVVWCGVGCRRVCVRGSVRESTHLGVLAILSAARLCGLWLVELDVVIHPVVFGLPQAAEPHARRAAAEDD